MIKLTKVAAEHMRRYLGSSNGVRIGIRNTGCAGYMYTISITEHAEPNDHIFNFDGINIFIKVNDLPYIDGVEIDYVKQGLQEGFKVNNPNAKATCGCGESFSVK